MTDFINDPFMRHYDVAPSDPADAADGQSPEAPVPSPEATVPSEDSVTSPSARRLPPDEHRMDVHRLDVHRLGALLAQANLLAEDGGLSPDASDAQKWLGGDLVNAMLEVVAEARDRLLDPLTPVTLQAKAAYQVCADNLDAFLASQGLTRGTLVDAALTAAVFPPGDPIRQGPLSFSHARTLSRLGQDRAAWTARAVQEHLSVGRLQALINTMDTAAAPGRGRARPHHNHVCAFSGEAITDLAATAELRVTPEVIGEAALAALPVRTSARGGAARPGAEGTPRPRTLLLRFASLGALRLWLIGWAQSRLLLGDEEPSLLPGVEEASLLPGDEEGELLPEDEDSPRA